MTRKPALLVLSALGWLGFNAVTVWTVGFLADALVPRTVDGAHRVGLALAITTDLGLLLLFAVQHSLKARPFLKAAMRRIMPQELERTAYVLATDVCLIILLLLWQPFGGPVWSVAGWAAGLLWVLCGAGWGVAVAATWAVDHFELTGLRQAGWLRPQPPVDPIGLRLEGMYAVVRHPLMSGLILAFWATPRMGAAHLLFAAAATGYVLIGIRFEERDLRRAFGPDYDNYAARVPSLVPFARWGPRRGAGARLRPLQDDHRSP